ncbi:hypothetical protein JCM3765_003487 [Sporobolomyces pararoseus]
MFAKRARVDTSTEGKQTNKVEQDQVQLKRASIRRVPLDVWILIAEHLDPLSLLYLSRIDKEFHINSKSRTSQYAWKQACRKLGINPLLENEDIASPRLISFLYENYCSGMFSMQGSALLASFPNLHQRVLDCVVPSSSTGGPYVHYNIKKVNRTNFELCKSMSTESEEEQAVGFARFCESKLKAVGIAKRDGLKIQAWWRSRVSCRAFEIARRVDEQIGITWQHNFGQTVSEVLRLRRHIADTPLEFSDQEWDLISKDLVEECHRAGSQTLVESKPNSLVPSFAIYTEIPALKSAWLTESGMPARMHVKDFVETIQRQIDQGVSKAQRWMGLSFARIAAESLHLSSQRLPSVFLRALNPTDAVSPPVFFEGFKNYLNSTGLDVSDPSTLTKAQFFDFLDRYSLQSFFYTSGQPLGYIEAWSGHFEKMNSKHYQGPLFPEFSIYWYQVLKQVVTQIGRGDHESAKKINTQLSRLGPDFGCGACSTSGITANELLEHIKTNHYGQPNDTPQADLVLYEAPAPQPAQVPGTVDAPAQLRPRYRRG